MRFQRRDTGQGSEFRIIDAPGELLPAVRKTAFTDGGDHWHRAFPADTPHLDRAWANFQRLIEPCLARPPASIRSPGRARWPRSAGG